MDGQEEMGQRVPSGTASEGLEFLGNWIRCLGLDQAGMLLTRIDTEVWAKQMTELEDCVLYAEFLTICKGIIERVLNDKYQK